MAFDFPSNPLLDQTYTLAGISYYWNGYAWLVGVGTPEGPVTDYVLKVGDTMLGFLTLNADPTTPLHAATKQYVDDALAVALAGGTPGQAIVKSPSNTPAWGAPIEAGSF